MKKVIVLSVAMLCLLSCNDNKMKNVYEPEDEVLEDSLETFEEDTLQLFEEDEPPVAVDELFDDFFFNFMDDPRFQTQRIGYPLRYKVGGDIETLSKKDWDEHNHFEGLEVLSVIYEREQDYQLSKDTSMQHVGVEYVKLKRDEVEKFFFNRVEGKWMLTEIEKKKRGNMPNGSFINFYAKFISDSIYQRGALAEPVKVILTSNDGEKEPEEDRLNADEWFEMRQSLPLPTDELINVDYGQACISQHKKTLLLQGIGNGMQIKFKFVRDEDDWKLNEIEY